MAALCIVKITLAGVCGVCQNESCWFSGLTLSMCLVSFICFCVQISSGECNGVALCGSEMKYWRVWAWEVAHPSLGDPGNLLALSL